MRARSNKKNRPSSSSKHLRYNIHGSKIVSIEQKEEDLTTRQVPSSSRPVSLRFETKNGKTPNICTTMSTNCGMPRAFVRMAFLSARRQNLQSQVSARFSRLSMNTVVQKASNFPKIWKQSSAGIA